VRLAPLVLAGGLAAIGSGVVSAGVFVARGSDGVPRLFNVPDSTTAGAIPEGSGYWRASLWPTVERTAHDLGLDPHLLDLMIRVESGYNAHAVSPKGARGVMQLMPDTARMYGVANVFNAYENIRAGARYFKDLLDRFGADVRLALAAYNAGPDAVERHGGVPPYPETQDYVSSILGAYKSGDAPLLRGGFGRGIGRRPVTVSQTAQGPVLSNARHFGEASLDRPLSLR
jgi:Transglycosylase SLT domain